MNTGPTAMATAAASTSSFLLKSRWGSLPSNSGCQEPLGQGALHCSPTPIQPRDPLTIYCPSLGWGPSFLASPSSGES
jgi:hypothetical protein